MTSRGRQSGAPQVLFCSYYTGLGGGETSLLSLLARLAEAGGRPLLLCPRPGRLPELAEELGVRVCVTPYRGASTWFVPGLWRRLPAARRIESMVETLGPEVLHSDFHTLPFVVPVCRRLGIPLIFTCLGWWFRPKIWQRAFFREGPSVTLSISDAVKEGFLGKPPFMDPAHVQTLHLGVDVHRFRPRVHERAHLRNALALPPNSPVVTFLGRYQDVKGHDVFLSTAARVAAKRPDACFVIAGENVFGARREERLKKKIQAAVTRDSLLRDRVRFLGWVSDSEKLLAATDVFVCSSRFESFGLAIVEAMACGAPVVSTNRGGPAETVVHEETGFLTPPGRCDLIADHTLRLLDDDALRRRMGEAGRARVCELFSADRYASRFVGVLTRLANKGLEGWQRAEKR